MTQAASRFKEEMAQYTRDGYTVFRGVLDRDLVEEASGHVDWLLEKNPGLRPEKLNFELAKKDAFWHRLISDDRMLDVAEQFIGPHIGLFATHYISKPPRDGMPVLWHQDGYYWPLEPMEVVTLWLAVDPSRPENGCMRVIPGTQNDPYLVLKQHAEVEHVLSSGLTDDEVDTSDAVDVVLEPGDVSVHHPGLLHGSNPNTSDMRRCGLTIRYIPTTTRITKNFGSPFHFRGQVVEGVNEYLPRPKYIPGESYPFRDADRYA